MLGRSRDDGMMVEMTGIVPACVTDIFRLVDERSGDAKHTVTVSVMEVYNNNIRDLLSDRPDDKHEITEGNGVAEVATATHLTVDSCAAVLQCVTKGIAARSAVSMTSRLWAHCIQYWYKSSWMPAVGSCY